MEKQPHVGLLPPGAAIAAVAAEIQRKRQRQRQRQQHAKRLSEQSSWPWNVCAAWSGKSVQRVHQLHLNFIRSCAVAFNPLPAVASLSPPLAANLASSTWPRTQIECAACAQTPAAAFWPILIHIGRISPALDLLTRTPPVSVIAGAIFISKAQESHRS